MPGAWRKNKRLLQNLHILLRLFQFCSQSFILGEQIRFTAAADASCRAARYCSAVRASHRAYPSWFPAAGPLPRRRSHLQVSAPLAVFLCLFVHVELPMNFYFSGFPCILRLNFYDSNPFLAVQLFVIIDKVAHGNEAIGLNLSATYSTDLSPLLLIMAHTPSLAARMVLIQCRQTSGLGSRRTQPKVIQSAPKRTALRASSRLSLVMPRVMPSTDRNAGILSIGCALPCGSAYLE